MEHGSGLRAAEALEKLKDGNLVYLNSDTGSGDVSRAARLRAYENGQSPFAVVLTCSDSRVIPECIFSAGIGDLFVVRAAGNTVGGHELGSIEYALDHLGCRLIVVMGHTGCGAVTAAMAGRQHGFVEEITGEIRLAIGEEKDGYKASALNVQHSVRHIMQALSITNSDAEKPYVVGAMYRTDSGIVEFL